MSVHEDGPVRAVKYFAETGRFRARDKGHPRNSGRWVCVLGLTNRPVIGLSLATIDWITFGSPFCMSVRTSHFM